jgi:hypothetical protein
MKVLTRIVVIAALLTNGHLALAADVVQPNVLAAEGGRYVFGQVNHQRADQFMLDTKTGRIWRMIEANGALVLESVAYKDAEGNRTDLPKEAASGQQSSPNKK